MDGVLTVAALAWDPTFRGALAVIAGIVVLCGSVYLLLGTNLGARLGLLTSLAGLFGFLVILGAVWWMYGTGPIGDSPEWRVVEIVFGDVDEAATEEARDLSEWTELPEEDPSRGEAQAAVDAVLLEEGRFDATTDYLPVAAFEIGGKPERQSDGTLDRIANRVTNTLRLTHPPHYAVVQVQAVEEQETEPGEAPPTPVVDESAPTISVVMERDLGFRRLPPALFTVGCLIVFAVLANMLHRRDKDAAANRAAAEAVGS